MAARMSPDAFKKLDAGYARLRSAAHELMQGLEARDMAAIEIAATKVEQKLMALDRLTATEFPPEYRSGSSPRRKMLPQERLREDIRELVGAIRDGAVEGLILGVDRVRHGLEGFLYVPEGQEEDEVHMKVVVVMDCVVRKDYVAEGLLENAPGFIDYALGKELQGTDSPYRLGNATLYVDIHDFDLDRAEGAGAFAATEKDKWLLAPIPLKEAGREVG